MSLQAVAKVRGGKGGREKRRGRRGRRLTTAGVANDGVHQRQLHDDDGGQRILRVVECASGVSDRGELARGGQSTKGPTCLVVVG